MRRQWIIGTGLPVELLTEKARRELDGESFHQDSKEHGRWDAAEIAWCDGTFALAQKLAAAKRVAMPGAFAGPYAALLDDFGPGMGESVIDTVFAQLEDALPSLITAAMARQADMPTPLLVPHVPMNKQEALCRRLSEVLCFDFERGRLLFSPNHPFSGGTSDDAWITTRGEEENFLIAVSTLVHEAHHAKYEQNLPRDWRGQPAGEHLGMGMHEAMSLLGEAHACAGLNYFRLLSRLAMEIFERPDDQALSPENLRALTERVQPSLIRIHADELTYPAHILLRWRIEKEMLGGTLTAAGLPARWQELMRQLLGIEVPDAARGCNQDVHWPAGYVGYFPFYLIGRVAAAQLYAAACHARPEIPQRIGDGDFLPLHEWLTENVYRHGSLLTFDQILQNATGDTLNADQYLVHLRRRYLGEAA